MDGVTLRPRERFPAGVSVLAANASTTKVRLTWRRLRAQRVPVPERG